MAKTSTRPVPGLNLSSVDQKIDMTLALVIYRSHNFHRLFDYWYPDPCGALSSTTLYCVICSTHALERVSPRGCVVIFGIFPVKYFSFFKSLSKMDYAGKAGDYSAQDPSTGYSGKFSNQIFLLPR